MPVRFKLFCQSNGEGSQLVSFAWKTGLKSSRQFHRFFVFSRLSNRQLNNAPQSHLARSVPVSGAGSLKWLPEQTPLDHYDSSELQILGTDEVKRSEHAHENAKQQSREGENRLQDPGKRIPNGLDCSRNSRLKSC